MHHTKEHQKFGNFRAVAEKDANALDFFITSLSAAESLTKGEELYHLDGGPTLGLDTFSNYSSSFLQKYCLNC